MADAAYFDRTTGTYTSPTLGDVLDFVAFLMGTDKDNLGADERAQWVLAVNQQAALWRVRHRFKLWGEEEDYVLTWTAGNTREELPERLGELKPGATIFKADSSGEYTLPIRLYLAEDFDAEYKPLVGSHPTDAYDDDDAVAVIRGLSENKQLFLEITPTPSGGETYRIPFYSRILTVSDNTDVIDAPPEVCVGIQFGAAKQIALVLNPSKLEALAALEEQARTALRAPEARIVPRTGRVRPFEGYGNLRHGVARK